MADQSTTFPNNTTALQALWCQFFESHKPAEDLVISQLWSLFSLHAKSGNVVFFGGVWERGWYSVQWNAFNLISQLQKQNIKWLI